MAVFGRLGRTDHSLADLEAKVDALRGRFEANDAMLCAGTGGPAAGHDLRLYTLSLEVWGAAVTDTAAPQPAPPAPAVNPPPAKMNPTRPAPRGRKPVPARGGGTRRCGSVARSCRGWWELMRKAMEGVSDVAAWSMELRMKNQQLAGSAAAVRAEDRIKELTSLITRRV
uniref:Uncharacterized protein n=1 Tax=Arundo donax TaxID=35708 RepID=A0A0A9F7W8_ARUDO